jgi:hypothetical protein
MHEPQKNYSSISSLAPEKYAFERQRPSENEEDQARNDNGDIENEEDNLWRSRFSQSDFDEEFFHSQQLQDKSQRFGLQIVFKES